MPQRSASSAVSPATLKQRMLRQLVCDDRHERQARSEGAAYIAGVDEVGRGALFGPVVAAAVILPLGACLEGLRDSKQLRAAERERLAAKVHASAIAVSIAEVDVETIDRINIYQATRLAMRRAVEQLRPEPDHLLIDAMHIDHPCAQTSIIYGDSLSLSIAAASVVAKVYRDRLLCELHALYPEYGLDAHKGYGTPRHKAALQQYGPTPLHRKSFAPVIQSALFMKNELSSQESAI